MYLYGASGHAKVIIDILEASGEKIDGIISSWNPWHCDRVCGIWSRIRSGRSAWCNLFEKDKTTAERYSDGSACHIDHRTGDRSIGDRCDAVSHAGSG